MALGAVALASALAYPLPSSQAGSARGHLAPTKLKVESKSSLAKKSAIVSKSRDGLYIENVGQWNAKAVSHAHGNGVDYWISHNGLVMDFNRSATIGKKSFRVGHVVDMAFSGGETPLVSYEGRAKVKTDFLEYGRTRAVHAASYAEVRLNGIYPGIDMRNYFDGGRPRYDIVVKPGADASKVRMAFKGQKKLSISKSGNLVMGTSLGDMSEEGLKAYTVLNGVKTPVKAGFKLVADNQVSFDLGSYDHSAKLVIDPLIYGKTR
jgi:hypothetical protein